MADHPIPGYQAKAHSGETVKESDNGATAPAAQNVLDWRVSGGQRLRFCLLETRA
jgi:hypothetical protein